ncbi:hypothetical protein [Actinomadura sp. 6N118]|uniref:hypothetical protein n=1 Tax=Actinomadura sp. 6N118 TaxID=3375151 RepID=UPI0037BA6481
MIILSGVLVVVAIALLVAGIVAGNGESAQVLGLDALVVIYISIAVSVVSALCLALGVFLRRKELFGAGAVPSAAKNKRKSKSKKAPPVRTKTAPAKDEPADTEVTIPAPPANVPDDAVVFVVRGRKRYHLSTCRQLAGRDKEELTYVEAKEEGFSPCTACMPDTALAARAAVSVPAASAEAKAKTAELPRTPSKGAPAKPQATPAKGPAAPREPQPSASAAPTAPAPVQDITQAAAKPAQRKPAEKPADSGSGLPSAWPAPASPVGDIARAASKPDPRPSDPSPSDPSPSLVERTVTDRPVAAEPPAGEAKQEAAPPKPRASAEPDEGPQVRILSGTKRYHRTDCALIEDIGDEADDLEALSRAEAKARGCTPCLVCQPDKERARD